ncbi:hypothetical protein ACLOJK_017518 [Asimina triloba]
METQEIPFYYHSHFLIWMYDLYKVKSSAFVFQGRLGSCSLQSSNQQSSPDSTLQLPFSVKEG